MHFLYFYASVFSLHPNDNYRTKKDCIKALGLLYNLFILTEIYFNFLKQFRNIQLLRTFFDTLQTTDTVVGFFFRFQSHFIFAFSGLDIVIHVGIVVNFKVFRDIYAAIARHTVVAARTRYFNPVVYLIPYFIDDQ